MAEDFESRFEPRISAAVRQRAVSYAEEIKAANPQLALDRELEPLLPQDLTSGRSLHLDDYSSIPLGQKSDHVRFMQQRACLRATDNDIVALLDHVPPDYIDYFHASTGMSLSWLTPKGDSIPTGLAQACWLDRNVRRQLRHEIRHEGLRFIHPHISNVAVWELADLLRRSTRYEVFVVGPPPGVAELANDKVAFARIVHDLLGERYIPRTESACNLGRLSQLVHDLMPASRYIGIKVPNSVGGRGNMVVDTRNLHGLTLAQIRLRLKGMLSALAVPSHSRLLVDVWESHVSLAGSTQLWIPPLATGEPRIEGVFEQLIANQVGHFQGCQPVGLPLEIETETVDASYTIALLLQHLGYIGRCSFDFILVGDSVGSGHLEFIECNGRWGGTSAPMTLTNHLFGSYLKKPFLSRVFAMPNHPLTFADVRRELHDILYNYATNVGWALLYNPDRLQHREINAIVWGNSLAEVDVRKRELEARLAACHPAIRSTTV
ncbi:MAG: hypothetical protein KDB27_29305 [Planctomycetales bacterium]|nr:hypothetical protein [Planctomycetales bacterium]